jgi:prepilin-type N-terminal cleavage/methylation domain-containing protein
MKLLKRRITRRRGFTLIEMLTAILVVETLMAVALPLYLATVTDAEIKACRTNMQTIATIETAYKTAYSPHTYTTDLAFLSAHVEKTPKCPVGGIYSVVVSDGTVQSASGTVIGSGGILIKCNAFNHGSFAPGIDNL